jgi:hypothetical protein
MIQYSGRLVRKTWPRRLVGLAEVIVVRVLLACGVDRDSFYISLLWHREAQLGLLDGGGEPWISLPAGPRLADLLLEHVDMIDEGPWWRASSTIWFRWAHLAS